MQGGRSRLPHRTNESFSNHHHRKIRQKCISSWMHGGKKVDSQICRFIAHMNHFQITILVKFVKSINSWMHGGEEKSPTSLTQCYYHHL